MRSREIWDKIMPIPVGTRVRYIINDTRRKYKSERWFKAREKAIGRLATVKFICEQTEIRRYNEFFKHTGRLYEIDFDKEIDGYMNFYCVRIEVEVV